MATSTLACPTCGNADLNLRDYESMIVVTPKLALFTLACPRCSSRVSGVCPIPDELNDEVQFAAIEVGAGMGRIG